MCISKKNKIIELLNNNTPYSTIVSEVGCSKAAISYHANKLGLKRFSKSMYDWVVIQEYYDKGNTINKCISKFGFHKSAWNKAVKSGKVVPRSNSLTFEEIVTNKSLRAVVRNHILRNKIIQHKCAICGLEDVWQDKAISLHLDHINGIHNDHRLENLRFLCPNCHSQTSTYAGRNKLYKK